MSDTTIDRHYSETITDPLVTECHDPAKIAAISAAIMHETSGGATLRDALDRVCGAGTYDELIDTLYQELRGA